MVVRQQVHLRSQAPEAHTSEGVVEVTAKAETSASAVEESTRVVQVLVVGLVLVLVRLLLEAHSESAPLEDDDRRVETVVAGAAPETTPMMTTKKMGALLALREEAAAVLQEVLLQRHRSVDLEPDHQEARMEAATEMSLDGLEAEQEDLLELVEEAA